VVVEQGQGRGCGGDVRQPVHKNVQVIGAGVVLMIDEVKRVRGCLRKKRSEVQYSRSTDW
jgi:hypothetical protein